MDTNTIKEKFLARLPQDLANKIPHLHSKILDEGIEQTLNGKSSLNGKMPETDDEWYIALGFYFIAACAALEGVIKGTRQAFPNEPLNINIIYHGDTHKFEYEPLERK